jgi:protein-tyrosine phosphatase
MSLLRSGRVSVDRRLPFEACFNFRDLGGYETLSGHRVRWGAVFRSDALHRMTGADLELALGLGLRTVIDLRSSAELEEEGRFAHADDAAFHHLPVFEQNALPFKPFEPDDPEPPPGVDYAAMALTGRESIAAALKVIAEGEHAVVFHCAAGKDRTGIVAALVLSSLGVPDESITADYHLSEQAVATSRVWAEVNAPEIAAEMSTFPAWAHRAPMPVIQAFLRILRDRHGSIDGYLTDAGVERAVLEALRARLLET